MKTLLFILSVVAIVAFTTHRNNTGKKSYGSGLFPREDFRYYDWSDMESNNIKKGHRNDKLKAVIGNDTVDYYAASAVRCDELYKYCHFIGTGHMTGSTEVLNFYVPNDNYRLITVEQMLAERK